MEKSFFKGLKVVELASVLAGPAVGMFFAELGAEVIKIENKTTGGDVTRGWKLPNEDPEADGSAYFSSVNWGKQHLFLDLNDPADRLRAQQLITAADVVISNFKPSSAARLGMDAAHLSALHPGLIFAQLSAFADPEDESPAFDVVLQAEAGFMYMTGEPGRPPVKMPVALIDLLAAHQLKEGILLALLQREKTGRGATVSVSLLESALASLANQATNWLMAGHIPQRLGAQHPNIAPYGDTFFCADNQQVLLAVGTERQFQHLCRCIGKPELAEQPEFRNNRSRVQHRQDLIRVLEPMFLEKSLDEWMTVFKTNQVPAARIRDMKAVFELPDAQALILEEPAPDGTITRRVRTNVFKLS